VRGDSQADRLTQASWSLENFLRLTHMDTLYIDIRSIVSS